MLLKDREPDNSVVSSDGEMDKTRTASLTKIPYDLHIHTHLSACCQEKERQRPAQILTLAEEMGVGTVGFADHIWANPLIQPSDWYRPQGKNQIARLREELLSVTTTVRALVGCEAETVGPGKIGMTKECAATLDFVLLSCSHLHMKGFVEQPKSDAPADVARHLVKLFEAGVRSGVATAIAHPFVPFGQIERFDAIVSAVSDAEFLDIFGLAAQRGVALEVTTGYLVSPGGRFSQETPLRLLALAKKAGCRFTFGTDAHDPAGQRRLPELMRLVEAVGITQDDVLYV